MTLHVKSAMAAHSLLTKLGQREFLVDVDVMYIFSQNVSDAEPPPPLLHIGSRIIRLYDESVLSMRR